MIACGAASGTAVWSTRIIELASVIAASVIFMFRREVIRGGSLRQVRASHQGSESAISASRGAVLSRSERSGSATCQSTPTSGSSQAIPASVAGS